MFHKPKWKASWSPINGNPPNKVTIVVVVQSSQVLLLVTVHKWCVLQRGKM